MPSAAAISPAKVSVDLTSLTLGQLAEIEAITGRSGELDGTKVPPASTLQAIVCVLQRHGGNPDYSMDDAAKVKLVDLTLADKAPLDGPSDSASSTG